MCLRLWAPCGDRLAAEQEAAEADDAPALLEIVGGHIDDLARGVVAGIVDRKLQIGAGLVEQGNGIGLAGGVGNDGSSAPAGCDDVGDDSIERRLGAAGDQNIQAFGSKPLAELRAEALIRPDTDDNRRPHSSLPRSSCSSGYI
jgi:hypothetical protein